MNYQLPTVPITVHVPLVDYPRMAAAAEARGFESIAAFLLDLGLDRVHAPLLGMTEDNIGPLARAGMCDADIALATGLTVHQVAPRRRALGIPANRRYGRNPK